MVNNAEKSKIVAGLLIVILGVVGRFLLVEYARMPNFEMVTALSLIAGLYLGGLYSIIIPVSIVFLSDSVIGNGNVFIFTWSAFAVIGLFGTFSKGKAGNMKLSGSIVLALSSSIFFYIYTNLGWWIVSGMYEYSISGLIDCYIMAIPFFKNQIMGNMIFVPTAIYFAKFVSRSSILKQIPAIKRLSGFKNN